MAPTTVHLIISPHHVGIPNLAVGAGPYRIIACNLVPRLEAAGYTVEGTEIPRVDSSPREHTGEIGRSFEIMRRVATAVAAARAAGSFPVVLAGNCNNSVGTAAGLGLGVEGDLGGSDGGEIVWFDAHPDFDTPDEVETGYFDVNGVAILAGQCWKNYAASIPGHKPVSLSRFQYVGLRDLNKRQETKVKASPVGVVWGGDRTPKDGFASGLESLLKKEPDTERPCLVHFDVDSLDTSVGIANFAAAPGGLKVQDVRECMRVVRENRRPVGLTIASFDPGYDGADEVAEAAVQAIFGILGEEGKER